MVLVVVLLLLVVVVVVMQQRQARGATGAAVQAARIVVVVPRASSDPALAASLGLSVTCIVKQAGGCGSVSRSSSFEAGRVSKQCQGTSGLDVCR